MSAQVTEDAARWLSRLLDSSASREDFFAWLAESPRHVEEFLFVLADAQDLAALSPAGRERVDALAAELGMQDVHGFNVIPVSQAALSSYDEVITHDTPAPPRWRLHQTRRRFALAAGVVLAVATAFYWFTAGPGSWHTYETQVGEQRTLELVDGSIVHLNTDSAIAVRFSDRARLIRLTRGEALFDVEHDAKRTFSVRAEDDVIQAIGTQFDVYRRDGNTHVAVIDGLVQITRSEARRFPIELTRYATQAPPTAVPAGASGTVNVSGSAARLLSAGESAVVSAGGTVQLRADHDVSKAVAWRQRRLVFENDSLGEIAAEFNRYNSRVKIRVVGKAAEELHYSGTFDADAPEAVMQALAADSALQVEHVADEIIIRERE